MSETKYKLCKRAGLEIQEHRVIVGFSRGEYGLEEADFVRAADIEKLLEGAPVVRARLYDNEVFGEWFDKAHEQDTHTARLLLIEPIVKDTAEGLLSELLRYRSNISTCRDLDAILDRARRLLEAK